MRNDEIYNPKPQSMQLQLRGLGEDGERLYQEATDWIDLHPAAWDFIVANAMRLHDKGYVSANYLVNMVRNELHIAVKNGYAPVFARVLERDVPSLKGAFTKHKSQSDGWAV